VPRLRSDDHFQARRRAWARNVCPLSDLCASDLHFRQRPSTLLTTPGDKPEPGQWVRPVELRVRGGLRAAD
jgi:hypothetical protein